MQLDAEDDENAFYKPPVIPLPSESGQATDERLSGEPQIEAAATVTAEDD